MELRNPNTHGEWRPPSIRNRNSPVAPEPAFRGPSAPSRPTCDPYPPSCTIATRSSNTAAFAAACTVAPFGARRQFSASRGVPRRSVPHPRSDWRRLSPRSTAADGQGFADVLPRVIPPPERSNALAMPANQRVGLADHQHWTPVDQSRQRERRRCGSHRLRAWVSRAVRVQCQLLVQKQVLGRQDSQAIADE